MARTRVVMEGAETVRFFSRNADGFRELLSDRERNALAPVPLAGFLRLPLDKLGVTRGALGDDFAAFDDADAEACDALG